MGTGSGTLRERFGNLPPGKAPVSVFSRRALAAVVVMGLVLAGRVLAQEKLAPMAAPRLQPDEVIPLRPGQAMSPEAADDESWRLGEEQPYVDSVFGGPPPGTGCELCCGGSACPPDWYIDTKLQVYNRSKAHRRPQAVSSEQFGSLFQPNAQFNRTPRIFLQSVPYGIAPGVAVSLGRYLGTDTEGRDRFFEFEYWGLEHWRGSATFTGDRISMGLINVGGKAVEFVGGDLFSQFPNSVGGFNRADTQKLSYQSDINNFEFNLRFSPRSRSDRLVMYPDGHWHRECRPGFYLSYLTGVRYMRIYDEANFHSSGEFTLADGTPLAPSYGDYEIRVYNDMLGVQVGGECTYRACRWTADVHGKAGAFLDVAHMHSTITSSDLIFSGLLINDRFTSSKDVCALTGQVGLGGSYKITPNLIGKASYDFLWTNGIGLAPGQFVWQSARPAKRFDTGGVALYHGVNIGLEYAW
jgi:hypothetical protein